MPNNKKTGLYSSLSNLIAHFTMLLKISADKEVYSHEATEQAENLQDDLTKLASGCENAIKTANEFLKMSNKNLEV